MSEEKAKAALDYIRQSMGQVSANQFLDPHLWAAYLTRGAYHLENGLHNFADWSKQMISELGKGVQPHLDKLWEQVIDAKGNPTVAKLNHLIERLTPSREETEALQHGAKIEQAKQIRQIRASMTGSAARAAVTKVLQGKLPSAAKEPIANYFHPHEIEELRQMINESPRVSDMEMPAVHRALDKVLAGEAPTKSEAEALGNVFGSRTANADAWPNCVGPRRGDDLHGAECVDQTVRLDRRIHPDNNRRRDIAA